jgi:hypothetical protein
MTVIGQREILADRTPLTMVALWTGPKGEGRVGGTGVQTVQVEQMEQRLGSLQADSSL